MGYQHLLGTDKVLIGSKSGKKKTKKLKKN